MAISFVAGNTGTTTAYATSYTVAKPTNTDGDLVVAIVGGKGATLSGSGWTLLMQTTARSGGSQDQTSVYYKIANSEGTGSYTVTLSTTQVTCGWIGAYRGVDGSTPIDTTNKTIASAGGTTNFSPASITATAGQWGMVFGVGYAGSTNTPGTYAESGSPTVTFERADFGVAGGSPDNTSMVVAEYQSLSAGAFAPTVTRSPTSAAGDKGAFLLNPAAGSAPAGAPTAAATANDATVVANPPEWVNWGSFVGGTGSVTPGIPSGTLAGDLMILHVEGNASASFTTPAGWTAIGTASATATQLASYYKWAVGGDTSPTVADSGDHTLAVINSFRYIDPTNPIDAFQTSTGTSSGTASATGVTTNYANDFVVIATSVDPDSASNPTLGLANGAWSNSNISITQFTSNANTSGDGGGIATGGGVMASAGATGTTTISTVTSTHANIVIALKPIILGVSVDLSGQTPPTAAAAANGATVASMIVGSPTSAAVANDATTMIMMVGTPTAVAGAYDAQGGVGPIAGQPTAVAAANNTSYAAFADCPTASAVSNGPAIALQAFPDSPTVMASTSDKGVYYGAPLSRTAIVNPLEDERRVFEVPFEQRVFLVTR